MWSGNDTELRCEFQALNDMAVTWAGWIMNYRGSSRKLAGNAISAVLAAIEVFNKPRVPYRDEVTVVMLANAWELLLKAIVSKSGGSIYLPKKRGEPYKTIGIFDAFRKASESVNWSRSVDAQAVAANLELLVLYRNNVVHFYKESDFGSVLYSLMQTAIYNFRDLACDIFKKDIADEMTWQILPLAARSLIDPVEYLKGAKNEQSTHRSRAVQDFLTALKRAEEDIESTGGDSGRLLTLFTVSLQSTKKVSDADIVVGVNGDDEQDAVIIQRKVDPNKSHPFRQKNVLAKLRPELEVNQYAFLAITTIRGLREDLRYCWKDGEVSLVRWSPDAVTYINSMTPEEVKIAIKQYTDLKKKK